jgi:predicted MFS family arabinose efflux permease
MIDTLKQRSFSFLWVAGLISMIGDWVLFIGLPLHIYKITGSTLATGALLVVSTLPALVFGSIAGVFVDRWDRRRTMIITNVLQAILLLPLLLVQSAGQIWIIYAVLFVESTLSQFFTPAEKALLPQLVDAQYLASANSLNALNSNVSRLLGPALGGMIVGLAGLAGVAFVDALSFALAAVLIMFVVNKAQPSKAAEPSAVNIWASVGRVRKEWREGLDFVLHTPSLAALFAIGTITMVGEGFFGTLIVPFVLKVMRGSESDFGYLMAAQAVGGIIGSILIARTARTIPTYRLFGICAIAFGLLDLVLFYYPLWISGVGLGMLLIALVGIPAIGMGTGLMTLLQTLSTDVYRGRVFGVYGALSALLMLSGAVVSGILGEHVSIVLLLTIQGLGYVLAGILALRVLRRTEVSDGVRPIIKAEMSET